MVKKGKKKGKKAPKKPVFHMCPDCDIRVEKDGNEMHNCSVGVTVNLLEYRNLCCNCGLKRGWPKTAFDLLSCRFCKARNEMSQN